MCVREREDKRLQSGRIRRQTQTGFHQDVHVAEIKATERERTIKNVSYTQQHPRRKKVHSLLFFAATKVLFL